MRLAIGALLAATMLLPVAAGAQGRQDFTIHNKTGYTISEVYVSASKTNDWEEDVLGRDVLNNGERVEISFPRGEKACKHDLKVVYDDGEEAEWEGFDLCEVSTIGLRYNRNTGDTWADES